MVQDILGGSGSLPEVVLSATKVDEWDIQIQSVTNSIDLRTAEKTHR